MGSMRPCSSWEEAFVGTSVVLGESEDDIGAALGKVLRLPTEREPRARAVASMVAGVLHELDAATELPWRT